MNDHIAGTLKSLFVVKNEWKISANFDIDNSMFQSFLGISHI